MGLKFEPFQLTISPSFWKVIGKWKMEVVKSEPVASRSIYGYIKPGRSGSERVPPRLRVDETSFAKASELHLTGELRLYDTIDAFKALNLKQVLDTECEAVKQKMLSSSAFSVELCPFIILAYCNLKTHEYYYHFVMPTLAFSSYQVECEIVSSEQTLDSTLSVSENAVGIVDTSSMPNAYGWPLRNLIAFPALKALSNASINASKSDTCSRLKFSFYQAPPEFAAVGLEVSGAGHVVTARRIDLSSLFDPVQYRKSASHH